MTRMPILFAALALSGLAQAADTPATPALSATPASSPQAWAGKMLDPTQNIAAFKDPAVFAQLSNAMMNPATSMAMMQQGMDPNTTVRMLSGMMNPAAMQSTMQFTDPSIAMKWMAAGLDPRLLNALIGQGINPSNYLNMMMAPMSPQMMNMGTQMMNPALYGNWMSAPTNPAAMNAMMAPMNPNMYGNWMGAGMNPSTYGPWGQMMAMPSGPAGGMPTLDPATLMKLLQMLQSQIPASTPAATK